MGYFRNIIADARPRQVGTMPNRAETMYGMAGLEHATFPMAEVMDRSPLRETAIPGEKKISKRSPDSRFNKVRVESGAKSGAVPGFDENADFGGEEGSGASDRRRAVPPFGDYSETEQYVYSQSSRTASNEEEETETSVFPGGSRIHVTENGDEASPSVVSQFTESTSNFLESVMTRHGISGAKEESDTRTLSSNGRGENGVFLPKQGENMPSGGFSASPPLLFSSEEKDGVGAVYLTEGPDSRQINSPTEQEERVRRSTRNLKHPQQTEQQSAVSNQYEHSILHMRSNSFEQRENDRVEKASHREGDRNRQNTLASPGRYEVRREKRKEEMSEPVKFTEREQMEKRFVDQMAVSSIEPRKGRAEVPKVSIGSFEIIIEAPPATINQSPAQTSSTSLSSRRYLRRL